MKILIIFRGGYSRVPDPEFVCKNIEQYIVLPLSKDKHIFDVVFSTYNENPQKLEIFNKHLNPIKTFFTQNGQIINFKETLNNIKPLYDEYDYILFLRFEAIYKIPINEWNFQNKEGLILPFKEHTEKLFNETGWYNDNIIIVSKSSFETFYHSIIQAGHNLFHPDNTLHNIVNIIRRNDNTIQVHCLVDGYFQSNVSYCPQIEGHMSPLYILVHYPYTGKDRHLFGL